MENQIEIWRDCLGYDGVYQVSNLGNVKSLKFSKARVLKKCFDAYGYHHVMLRKNNKQITKKVHHLVAESFLEYNQNGYNFVINHKNHVRTDNNLENIEIVTVRQNTNKQHLNSSSQYIGVCWSKQRSLWISVIRIKGNLKYLGGFENEYDAHLAYENELKQLVF